MKLAVFGATGGTGKQVLEKALADGHTVVAVARKPDAITTTHARLSVVQGDVLDRASISASIAGAEAVISAFGPASNSEPGTLMSEGVANIVAACGETGVGKLVFESGLITTDGVGLSLFARTAVAIFRARYRKLYDDKVLAEATIRASDLAWVILRPPTLTDGPARGGYKTGVAIGVNPAKSLRHADAAAFLIACATDAGLDRTTQVIGY